MSATVLYAAHARALQDDSRHDFGCAIRPILHSPKPAETAKTAFSKIYMCTFDKCPLFQDSCLGTYSFELEETRQLNSKIIVSFPNVARRRFVFGLRPAIFS
jgi:hypothetical protein